MENEPQNLGRMLERDLDRLGINQRDLAAKLMAAGGAPLTEQAISNWKKDNMVPRRRLDALVQILGPGSEVAKAHAEGKISTRLPNISYSVREVTAPAPRVREARQQYEVAQHTIIRFSEVEQAVRASLPDDLQGNFERTYSIGAVVLRFDYISSNAVIDLNRSSSMGAHPLQYRSLFRLALARKVANDTRIYGLIVVLPGDDEQDDDRPRRYFSNTNRRLVLEASIMGLRLEFADSPENAAKIIQSWEKGEISEEEELF